MALASRQLPSSTFTTSLFVHLILLLSRCSQGGAFLWGGGHLPYWTHPRQPNIVMVVADDLGYNDVGYHGSEIRTPNIDALATGGVRLENYYVQPTCTPSRSTLLSGKYMIHTGLQHGVIRPCQPIGVPSGLPLLPELLVKAGYSTYGVGKWHLGHYSHQMLPTRRGFQRFFGYYMGYVDYYEHYRRHGPYTGLDMHEDERPAWASVGTYTTHLFTDKAIDFLRNHNSSNPLFLYVAYQAAHTPLEVPDRYVDQYAHIRDRKRRVFAGMVSALDEAVGNLTAALRRQRLWDNTLFVFTSDNGGSHNDGGSNWPLRGGKGTLWEGGTRAVGFVHGARLPRPGSVNIGLLHVADWLPTLVNLAGGSYQEALPLDGFDQWKTISMGFTSRREEILININHITPKHGRRYGNESVFDTRVQAAIRIQNWKLVTGNPGSDTMDPLLNYEMEEYEEEEGEGEEGAGAAGGMTWEVSLGERTTAAVCVVGVGVARKPKKNLWLFDLATDPRETRDLSASYPDVVEVMLRRLQEYDQTSLPPQRAPSDPRCDPSLRDGVWGPWM